jgi:hypothetical protein
MPRRSKLYFSRLRNLIINVEGGSKTIDAKHKHRTPDAGKDTSLDNVDMRDGDSIIIRDGNGQPAGVPEDGKSRLPLDKNYDSAAPTVTKRALPSQKRNSSGTKMAMEVGKLRTRRSEDSGIMLRSGVDLSNNILQLENPQTAQMLAA